jgi:hypothetical protein
MCHDMAWPQGVTMDLFNRLTEDVLWNYIAPYNYSNVVTLDIGFLLEQIYTNLQRIVTGTGSVAPFVLYAGHDSTLSPLLAALGNGYTLVFQYHIRDYNNIRIFLKN